jgi:hypothetical protein
MSPGLSVTQQAVVFHKATHGWVAWQSAKFCVLSRYCEQIVVDKLIAPARMISTQGSNCLVSRLRHLAVGTNMTWYLALECDNWIVLMANHIEPSLNRFGADPNHFIGAGVPPLTLCQF